MRNFVLFALMLFLVSCQDYTPTDVTAREIAYKKEFRSEFGYPSEGHTFGFIDQPVAIIGSDTRLIDNNSNQWYYTHQLNIPGYPDANGYFHGQKTTDADGYLTSYKKKSDIPNAGTPSEDKNWLSNNVGNPVGDVTTEEVEYVMEWFRTNRNPESTPIHWSEFFVQYIGFNDNGWEMDQLGYESIDGTWEHVNDFNGKTKTIKYVYNSGTEAWSYRASHSDTYQNDKYTIQYLSFTLENGHHYEGWYVGFDYESIKGDSNDVKADGYYCDWVIKVTPGTSQGYPITVRIMCEDLGGSFDWDFNDVVFDVSFTNRDGRTYAKIVLQCAGGTLPINVGTTDGEYEAHGLFNVTPETVVIKPKSVVVYTVDCTEYITGSRNTANAKNIPIYVRDGQATYNINGLSDVAQKFACPDDVDWADELQNICLKYPNIPAWISNEEAFNDTRDVWTENPKK